LQLTSHGQQSDCAVHNFYAAREYQGRRQSRSPGPGDFFSRRGEEISDQY